MSMTMFNEALVVIVICIEHNLGLIITVAHTCSALLIALDNINIVCEIGLL